MKEGEERIYVFNLRRAFDKPRPKRFRAAMKIIRKLASRHGKISVERVRISPKVNEFITANSLNIPRRVRVKLLCKDNFLYVLMPDENPPEKKVKKEKEEEKPKEKKDEKGEEKRQERENQEKTKSASKKKPSRRKKEESEGK